MGDSTFSDAPFSVTNAGVLKSTSGTIGGWTLSASDLSAGSGGSTIKLVPGTGIQLGHGTFSSAPFSVTNAGVLKAESGTIGGWTLGATSFTGGASPISSNWEETDNKYSRIGDAFSESSGIFTFPETGIYLITFQGRNNYNGAYAYYEVIINGSDDNFSSSNIIAGNTTSNAGGANRYSGAFTTALFDVTNTSNDKVSFRIATDQSSVTTAGDTTSTMTGATFIRLGDT